MGKPRNYETLVEVRPRAEDVAGSLDFVDEVTGGGFSLTPSVSEDYWVARIRLTGNQYINAFYKFSTIGIGLGREYSWNTNLPCYNSNLETILWLSLKIQHEDVFVYMGEGQSDYEDLLNRYKRTKSLTDIESLSELHAVQSLFLSNLSRSNLPKRLVTIVSYWDFDQRLTALKQVIKEHNAFGVKYGLDHVQPHNVGKSLTQKCNRLLKCRPESSVRSVLRTLRKRKRPNYL